MSTEIIPLFYDCNSLKSSLTFDDPKDYVEGGPIPIIKLLKENNLKECYFVSPNFHSFMQADKFCKKNDIILHFGLELWVTDDATILDENSKNQESKVIIWMKNGEGYQDLVELYSAYQTRKDFFYYHTRYDWKGISQHWTDNLILTIPFFDSFLARNTLNHGSNIIPAFPEGIKPAFFLEQNTGHPHEALINWAISQYNKDGAFEIVPSKTVYYASRSLFKSYMIFRVMHNKSEFSKPELDYFCSDQFSFEDYQILTKNK